MVYVVVVFSSPAAFSVCLLSKMYWSWIISQSIFSLLDSSATPLTQPYSFDVTLVMLVRCSYYTCDSLDELLMWASACCCHPFNSKLGTVVKLWWNDLWDGLKCKHSSETRAHAERRRAVTAHCVTLQLFQILTKFCSLQHILEVRAHRNINRPYAHGNLRVSKGRVRARPQTINVLKRVTGGSEQTLWTWKLNRLRR